MDRDNKQGLNIRRWTCLSWFGVTVVSADLPYLWKLVSWARACPHPAVIRPDTHKQVLMRNRRMLIRAVIPDEVRTSRIHFHAQKHPCMWLLYSLRYFPSLWCVRSSVLVGGKKMQSHSGVPFSPDGKGPRVTHSDSLKRSTILKQGNVPSGLQTNYTLFCYNTAGPYGVSMSLTRSNM